MREFVIAMISLGVISMASTVQAGLGANHGHPCIKKVSGLYRSGKVARSCREIRVILNGLSQHAAGHGRCSSQAKRYFKLLQQKKNSLCMKLIKRSGGQTTIMAKCNYKGRGYAKGTIIFQKGARRIKCSKGQWHSFRGSSSAFTGKPPTGKPYSCGSGGCNCWGDFDCNNLTQSGKCHGNPITCDPNNQNACHCD